MKKEDEKLNLVTVAIANNIAEATMIQSILEEDDIVVFMQDELSAQFYTVAVGGIKIQVSSMDAEKARNLLADSSYARYLV